MGAVTKICYNRITKTLILILSANVYVSPTFLFWLLELSQYPFRRVTIKFRDDNVYAKYNFNSANLEESNIDDVVSLSKCNAN